MIPEQIINKDATIAVATNLPDQEKIDQAQANGLKLGTYEGDGVTDYEQWEYIYDSLKGVGFHFSDNPAESMNVRDVLYWL